MKIILNEDIKGIGKKGDVVDVNDGYGRNFILKNNKGIIANDSSVKNNDAIQSKIKEKEEKKRQEALKIKETLDGQELVATIKTGSNGKLFGSFTTQQIVELLNEKYNLSFNKKKIELKDTIKTCGTYEFKVKVYPKIAAKMKLTIEAES